MLELPDIANWQVPTLSGWIFYFSNVVIVAGYAAASLAITRRKGLAKGFSWRVWLAGLSFFLFCGLTHVELAIHAFFNLRIINLDGTVDWHMLAIHIPQAASIWLFLWASATEKGQDDDLPLEGLAPPSDEELAEDERAKAEDVRRREHGR